MNPRFARFLLERTGWALEGGVVPEDKCVFLQAPHTSLWDFVIGYLYYRAVGGKLHIMIKKEMFFFPLGALLRSMGGFPIDRSKPQAMIMSVVHRMQGEGIFHLAICPEGTRKPVHKWKTGYHTIAREAGVPVYLAYIDWKRKRVGSGEKFTLTENAREDTDRIQKAYEEMGLGAKHPERYFTN